MSLSHTTPLTYFDNGATSFPKPPEVADAVVRYLTEVGGNYGRSAPFPEPLNLPHWLKSAVTNWRNFSISSW